MMCWLRKQTRVPIGKSSFALRPARGLIIKSAEGKRLTGLGKSIPDPARRAAALKRFLERAK